MFNDIEKITNRKFKLHKESLNRENIMYHHFNFSSEDDKENWLLKEIKKTGPTIIYVSSKEKMS